LPKNTPFLTHKESTILGKVNTSRNEIRLSAFGFSANSIEDQEHVSLMVKAEGRILFSQTQKHFWTLDFGLSLALC